MLTDESKAPILEALAEAKKKGVTSFATPGHRSGKGAPQDVKEVLGAAAFEADSTTQKGIDDRRETRATVQKAENLAALAWGAEYAHLSTNGTSLSNHAAFLCVAAPGDTVLVGRNAHRSVIASLILARLRPVFLEPSRDEAWDVEHGISAAELERALAAHPEAKGAFVTSPTYYGVVPDLRRLAGLCHDRGKPLVVDEAWGPHLHFHPEMPPSAIASGADMALGSIHKTLAGLQGASVMLLRSKLIPRDRFALCYDLFQSTSPPVQVLASIDATRRQYALHGGRLVGDTLRRARRAREALAEVEGIRVMGREVLDGDASSGLDETKVLLDISGLGVTGYAADDWLTAERNISVGLSDERHLLAVFTAGNDDRDTDALVKGIRALAKWAGTREGRRHPVPAGLPARKQLRTEMAMLPAEAFFGRVEQVPLAQAAGRVAAEMVSPYPPGIPYLLPGQRITEPHVAFFRLGLEAGLFPLGTSAAQLETLRVVA